MGTEEKIQSVDNSQAKIIAYIVVFGFIAIMLVFGLKNAGKAPLREGDREQSMTCKWCEGAGTLEGERCKYCLGAKKLKVIVPGPKHPVRIRGSIRDLSAFESEDEAREVAEKDADYSKVVLKPMRGAVGQAKIQFVKEGYKAELESKPSGRYFGYVEPGEYTMVVEVDGFAKYELPYTVPVRKEPVWPKIPGVEVEDPDQLEWEIFLSRP